MEEEKEEWEEKIPHICESIGPRPLRGHCPAPPSTLTTTYLGRARFCDYSSSSFGQRSQRGLILMLSYTWGIFFSFWPAAQKGSMTYAFTQGNFLLLLLLLRTPPTSRPISQPHRPYPSLEAQIPVLRSKSQPQGPNPILQPKSYL